MSHNRDSSPVYYREIQKNAYLKRLPDDITTSKPLGLRPLALKKPLLKPLWTQLCVHNGRTPYLEQYRDPTSARAHRPVWRASLLTARHVTASVTARDNEYDFLVDTHHGPVRMLAPDWDSMQDWVTTLRNKLHELKILPLCENVYAAPPAAPPPRAAARDPTSPLPPTPPVPPDRVPGIDLTPIVRNNISQLAQQSEPLPAPESAQTESVPSPTLPGPSPIAVASSPTLPTSPNVPTTSSTIVPAENIDISSWDEPETAFTSLPSTSQVLKSVTKICGQNICLDDSIFKRTNDSDDDDFISEDRSSLDSRSDSLGSRGDKVGDKMDNASKLASKGSNMVNAGSKLGSVDSTVDNVGSKLGSLCNKLGSIGSDENTYRQTVIVNDKQEESSQSLASERPSNITVIQVSNKEPPHTAIPVIGPETDIFDFNFKTTKNPNFVNIVNTEVNVQNSNDYGTVFEKDEPEYGHLSLTTTVSLTGDVKPTDVNVRSETDSLYERLCLASTSNNSAVSPLSVRRLKTQEKVRKSSLPNLDAINSDSTYEYLFLSQNSNGISTNVSPTTVTMSNNIRASPNIATSNINAAQRHITSSRHINNVSSTSTMAANITISTNSNMSVMLNESNSNSRVHVNQPIVDPNSRVVRSNIDRINSQNVYEVSPRMQNRTEQSNSPKWNGKVEKLDSTQAKPIWKRGLTELSLLTRLRGIAHGRRHDSPERHEHDRNVVPSPVKVVHRSRPEVRVDRNRRRSSSLSNGQSPPSSAIPPTLQPLRARQAAALRSEQRRGAALVAAVRCAEPPVFADYNKQVWVAWWGSSGVRCSGRAGDRVVGVRAALPRDAAHARSLVHDKYKHVVDILFHRVPLGKIYVVNKRDQESTGIKLDNECNITSVEADSPAAIAGIPPPGKWAVTEVNNRPINLLKCGEEDMNRLSLHGTEASILIQPSALVKKLRAALKGNKTLLGLR